jgi:hypothetical protein
MPVLLNPWSYTYIRKRADEATIEAKQNGLYPVLASKAAMNYKTSRRFNIPFLGDYVPEGWERTGEIGFVDTTGTAKQGDPAMPTFEFLRRIQANKEPIGLGVIEIGQTQALIATYRKEAHGSQETETESGDQRRRSHRRGVTRRRAKAFQLHGRNSPRQIT